MKSLALALVLALPADVLKFPGKTVVGTVKSNGGQSCRVVAWLGNAPDVNRLSEEERRQLQELQTRIFSEWEKADRAGRAALIRSYLRLLTDDKATFPAQRRWIAYSQVTVTCGGEMVRGALARFSPFAAGAVAVLFHPQTASYLVMVDREAKPGEFAETLAQFLEAYKQELVHGEGPDQLPEGVRKRLRELQKGWEREREKRLRFWDINGLVLPSCPEKCPAGTLAFAFETLDPQAKRMFGVLLGLWEAKEGESGDELPFSQLGLFPGSWPRELGPNEWVNAREELENVGSEPVSFSLPGPEWCKELWPGAKTEPPSFAGDLRQTIKEMLRTVR
ncbi:MAG: hypothetical protein ACP5NF_10170 [Thermoanaerobaculum sp.]